MIKRFPAPATDAVPQWQTLYCSLMLLLFVFFLTLVSYSAIDNQRLQQVRRLTPQGPDPAARSAEMDQAMQSMERLSQEMGRQEDLAFVKTQEGFKAVIPTPVLFDSGDASLNDKLLDVLDGIAEIARQKGLVIQIEGHTDNQPIDTARFPSNWELSTQRAVNVLRYLQEHGGVAAGNLVAVGFGEYHPLASNDSPEGRKRNRRIEILFRQGT